MRTALRIIILLVVAVVALGLLIQLVPYGRAHANPPVQQEPPWSSPEVRQLAVRACYDCHSNETTYPWYSNIAPVSWLVQRDINEGRRHLNFSEWGMGRRETEHLAGSVKYGDMPPFYYTWEHPTAKLSDQEKQTLVNELLRLAPGSDQRGREGGEGGE